MKCPASSPDFTPLDHFFVYAYMIEECTLQISIFSSKMVSRRYWNWFYTSFTLKRFFFIIFNYQGLELLGIQFYGVTYWFSLKKNPFRSQHRINIHVNSKNRTRNILCISAHTSTKLYYIPFENNSPINAEHTLRNTPLSRSREPFRQLPIKRLSAVDIDPSKKYDLENRHKVLGHVRALSMPIFTSVPTY